jgi:FixJ family two-component response regulator
LIRLLVVDDDSVDRAAVRRVIARSGLAGAEIVEAADAGTAIATATSGAAGNGDGVDCILLDYQLGADTGLDVLEALRARGSHIPVVMLTGRSDPLTVATLMKAGASDFLTKELLAPDRLEQVIRAALRLAAAERAARKSQEELETTHRRLQEQAAQLAQQIEEAQALTEELEQTNEHLQEVNA